MLAFLNRSAGVPRNPESALDFDPSREAEPEAVGLTRRDVDKIWLAVEGLYRSDVFPAITFCMRRKGQVVINRALGHAREGVPATPDTPICLFSASKAVTAMMIHLLAEQGEISLDDPVAKYLPEFAANGKGRTTIFQVLAHRSGIPRVPPDTDPAILYDWDGAVEMLCKAVPEQSDARRQAYHAVTGGFILGEVLKRVTGDDIRAYIDSYVCKPLGFEYFNYGVPADRVDEVARNAYTGWPLVFPLNAIAKRALGAPWEQVVEVSNDPRYLQAIVPAGNLIATADEASRFFQCLLNGGELDGVRIFKESTVRRAIEPVGGTSFDYTMFIPMRYSAGMMLGNKPIGMYGPNTEQAFGHLGYMSIFCWADPQRDISVAFLNTGKALLGPHLPALAGLLNQISRRCLKP